MKILKNNNKYFSWVLTFSSMIILSAGIVSGVYSAEKKGRMAHIKKPLAICDNIVQIKILDDNDILLKTVSDGVETIPYSKKNEWAFPGKDSPIKIKRKGRNGFVVYFTRENKKYACQY